MDEKLKDEMIDNTEINDEQDDIVVRDYDSDLESLEKQLEDEKKRADEFLVTAKRLQAEFDNYRKRTNETNKRVKEDGNIEVIMGLLPVLDAIVQAKKMISDENTLSGINIIDKQIGELLNRFGVKKIEALGEQFDPNLHNAIMQMDVSEEEKKNCVVEVYQEGYILNDRVLRHSVVIVGK